MDPLSITASVAGLITAIALVTNKIRSIIVVVKDAPREIHALLTELSELQIAVAALKGLMGRASQLPKSRTCLISLDQLVATLTEAVLNVSEIEALLEPIIAGIFARTESVRIRLRSLTEQDTIKAIVQRIQRNKASLNLVFNIIQW